MVDNNIKINLSKIALQLINDEIDVLEGVREIVYQSQDLPEDADSSLKEIILKFESIESQTDHIPNEEQKSSWNLEAYKKIKNEKQEYINFFKEEIIENAKKLIKVCA